MLDATARAGGRGISLRSIKPALTGKRRFQPVGKSHGATRHINA